MSDIPTIRDIEIAYDNWELALTAKLSAAAFLQEAEEELEDAEMELYLERVKLGKDARVNGTNEGDRKAQVRALTPDQRFNVEMARLEAKKADAEEESSRRWMQTLRDCMRSVEVQGLMRLGLLKGDIPSSAEIALGAHELDDMIGGEP